MVYFVRYDIVWPSKKLRESGGEERGGREGLMWLMCINTKYPGYSSFFNQISKKNLFSSNSTTASGNVSNDDSNYANYIIIIIPLS